MNVADIKKIRKSLQTREFKRREHNETLRLETLAKAKSVIRQYFSACPGTQVYLAGSIIRPGAFSAGSDIDIAVDGFSGSRLDLYADLSYQFDRPIDIIIMDTCHFADSIRHNGLLVISSPC